MELTFSEEIKNMLAVFREKMKLTDYEYTNLISLLVLKQILTHDEIKEFDINVFINIIKKDADRKVVNDNNQVYKQAIQYIVNKYFTKTGVSNTSYYEIMNNWFNGYLFHTLNDAFVDNINEHGFILEDKPWDIEEIKRIKSIFNKAIFGVSNAEDNVIFFTSTLASSPYYGLTSPTFFRKFVENDPKKLNIFLNRDLASSNESIIELCQRFNITGEDYDYVMSFFKKYWSIFSNNRLPSLLLLKRDHVDIEEPPTENMVEYVINRIYNDSRNKMIRQDIKREDLTIFSYEDLEITKKRSLQL